MERFEQSAARLTNSRDATSLTVRAGSMVGSLLLAIGMLAVSARISVPLAGPVPVTLQTLAVLVIGMMFGANLGVAAVGGYLLAGSMLPVLFAPGSLGLAGPTGGYLLGFLPAVWLAGRLLPTCGMGRSFDCGTAAMSRAIGVFVVATAAVFACGLVSLTVYTRGDVGLAIKSGLLPLLPGAAIKIMMATAIYGLLSCRQTRRSTLDQENIGPS